METQSMEKLQEEATLLKGQIKEAREKCRDIDPKEVRRFFLKQDGQNFTSVEKLPIRQRRVLRGHMSKIYAIDWSQDSNSLISASQDGHLIVWDTMTTNKQAAIPLRCSWVMTCCYSPCGNIVVSGGLDNIVSIFSLRAEPGNANFIKELKSHDAYISDCKFIEANKLITSSGDKTTKLWDVEAGTCLTTFLGHSKDVLSLSIQPGSNCQVFVTGSCDKTCKIWDIRTGKCMQTFEGHDNDVNSVAFFPNGEAVCTASEDGTSKLFSMKSDQVLMTYTQTDTHSEKEAGCLTSVDFSLSGRLLFLGRWDNHVQVNDTVKGELITSFKAHEDLVHSLAVSPNGMALATGSWDHFIKIWV